MENLDKRILLIEAIPLTIPRSLEGTFYWYEDYIKLKEKPANVIIGSIDQRPDLLLVKDYAQGYLIKYGGFTSHLAIVGRELGIPIYRYNKLEYIRSGDKIIVIPTAQISVNIPDSHVWTIRHIEKDETSLLTSLDHILMRTYNIIRRFNEFFTVEKFDIQYDRNKKENIVYVYIKTTNMRETIEEVINNPGEAIKRIMMYDDEGTSFICKFLAEILTPYLMKKVGVDRALRAIHRHTPYWLNVHEDYLKIRFGITDTSVKEYLKNLAKESKRKPIILEEPYESLAKLIAMCIEKYESKNYRSFR